MTDELLEELEKVERAGWDSLCDGTAGDFYGRTMTSDARMVLANGMTMTRDEVVKALGAAPSWDGYALKDVRLVTTGRDSAALVYTGTAKRDGEDDIVCAMSSTYARINGTWRLAVYTQTPVA